MLKPKSISQQLAEKIFKELGFDPKTGKVVSLSKGKLLNTPTSSYSPLNQSLRSSPPFRIKALYKTLRQSPKGKAYLYSAVYRNAYILRLLGKMFTSGLDPVKYRYLISQIDSELRSVVANIREGYLRPTSGEFSTFLGYSQGSLEEFRGDVIDAKDDSLLPSRPGSSLDGIGIHLKPLNISPKLHLDSLKRRIGELKRSDLTYEIFMELINKTDWLVKRAVEGIDRKIIKDETEKLKSDLNSHWRKVW
ncbi:MAG TPA: four helix bundle protein [Patescibacteria group bacterium]|uniref:Uncharacterized protein n=1 Tax=Candidatus Woesebacteria bacterium RIFCSPHIGHO2_01_FULL_40_22 TaxID=1802499 RepID=A0A1F7YHB0_9BACT|nr:MAG: hypothetical protein A2628_04280 [Candidatus Woesebacteria bacterium RIFCSPHIGHO2_01_FULL_40_22]HJZ04306.1 four helix bundle protein [Patescibacteria group bacterium]